MTSKTSTVSNWKIDQLDDLTGMSYNPLTQEYKLGTDVSVNYLACFRKA